MKKFKLIKTLAISAFAFLFLFLAITTIAILYKTLYLPHYFLPNSYIGNTNVSHLSKDGAIQKLNKNNQNKNEILILIGNEKFSILNDEIDLNINYKLSVQKALDLQKTKNFLDIAKITLNIDKNHQIYPIEYSLNEKSLDQLINSIYNQSTSTAVFPSIYLENNAIKISEGKTGTTFNKEEVRKKILDKIKTNNNSPVLIDLTMVDPRINKDKEQELISLGEKLIGKEIVLSHEDKKIIINDNELVSFLGLDEKYNTTKIKNYIQEKVVPLVNSPPQNAMFKLENSKVIQFAPSKEGSILIEDLLINEIVNILSTLEYSDKKSITISIPLQKKQAEIKTEDTNNFGIKELIGKGKSSFKGSIPGRIHNIELASSKFNGILIAPNETLSFNEILGDVSKYTGYKQAYVIRSGRTILGDGGGVCQVSTTLFRAALNAGLPITERRPHSYRVGYYEQDSPPGLDATVFAPTTDFKFKNDTNHYILIQTQFDQKTATLIFELYGTNDGRIVELTKPIIKSSTPPPDDLYIDDPNLPEGKIVQVEHKAWGAKVVFDYTVTKPNQEPIKTTFVSNYRPWGAVFTRGTKPIN